MISTMKIFLSNGRLLVFLITLLFTFHPQVKAREIKGKKVTLYMANKHFENGKRRSNFIFEIPGVELLLPYKQNVFNGASGRSVQLWKDGKSEEFTYERSIADFFDKEDEVDGIVDIMGREFLWKSKSKEGLKTLFKKPEYVENIAFVTLTSRNNIIVVIGNTNGKFMNWVAGIDCKTSEKLWEFYLSEYWGVSTSRGQLTWLTDTILVFTGMARGGIHSCSILDLEKKSVISSYEEVTDFKVESGKVYKYEWVQEDQKKEEVRKPVLFFDPEKK